MGGNPQGAAAAGVSDTLAKEQTAFANSAFPAIQSVMSAYMADLGTPGQEPNSVKTMFQGLRDQTNQNFSSAELGNSNAIATRAKSMGLDYRPNAVSAVQGQAGQQLEQQRFSTLQNLGVQEANFGLNQTDSLLARMGNIERALAGAGSGYASAALGDIGSMSQVSPWGSALGGAIGGAGAMAGTGNPYAIAGGAIVGGTAGYFQGGG